MYGDAQRKVATLLNPCRHYRPSCTNITTLATDTGNLALYSPHRLVPREYLGFLDYIIYDTKACQKLWANFISFGKTATVDTTTTDTTTTDN
jgi:hypothetical protein